MDQKFLPFAVLLLLLTGSHEQDVLDELTERSNNLINSRENPGKIVKSQTYVRATTLEEFIEVERTDEDGKKSYKVEAKLEPFEIQSPIKEVIKDKGKNVKATLELTKLKLEGINKFKISGTSNKSKNEDGADISFDLPDAVELRANYVLDGIVSNKRVKGSGTIDLSVIGVSVRGLVQISDDEQELRIQRLDLAYNFGNIRLRCTGLEIEGMNQKQSDDLLLDLSKKYLRENSRAISERLANDIRIKLNIKLKGVSSAKIISLLKTA